MSDFIVKSLKIDLPDFQITSEPFHVKPGEYCEIKASSGFGKTTFLRALLGFQKMQGEISLGEKRLDLAAPHNRNFGVVFQDQLLFPHLNAMENALFGLKLRRRITGEDQERGRVAFQSLGIEARSFAPIQELSGGERQRVALIRATLFNPDVLFLDEPFKGLDEYAITKMTDYLNSFLFTTPVPVIFVSHQGEVVFHGVQLIGEEQHESSQRRRHFRFTGSES